DGRAALAAKVATTPIPIVMDTPGDHVGQGLVARLTHQRRSGGGRCRLNVELNSNRLEILKPAVIKLARDVDLRPPGAGLLMDLVSKELRRAAQALKVKLEEIGTQADLKSWESAFQTAKQKQVGAIMTTAAASCLAERKRIVELAGKYRLPAIYAQK